MIKKYGYRKLRKSFGGVNPNRWVAYRSETDDTGKTKSTVVLCFAKEEAERWLVRTKFEDETGITL